MASARHTARLIGLALALLLVLPRFALRTGLAETACTGNNFDPSALRGDAAEGDWLVYRNTKDGLSFRYPPSMRVKERDPATFGYEEPFVPDVIVDLRGDGSNSRDLIVMRFICARGQKTPETAAARARALSESHPHEDSTGRVTTGAVGSMQIDGHEAIVTCGCGRAACQWSVVTLQPRECMIFPMDPGDPNESRLPLHDGESPLLSIIKTVHFQPTKR
jgi:hypothetical protein